jgi:hypothetical protein
MHKCIVVQRLDWAYAASYTRNEHPVLNNAHIWILLYTDTDMQDINTGKCIHTYTTYRLTHSVDPHEERGSPANAESL